MLKNDKTAIKFYNKYIHPDLSEEFGKLQLKQSQQK